MFQMFTCILKEIFLLLCYVYVFRVFRYENVHSDIMVDIGSRYRAIPRGGGSENSRKILEKVDDLFFFSL